MDWPLLGSCVALVAVVVLLWIALTHNHRR